MRFRLHTTASSGQVITNTAALDALLLRVANLESADSTTDVIEITTGVNDTFIFKHTVVIDTNPTTTYTLVLAQQSYTLDEMVAALNSAIVAHGAVANNITTTMTLVDGKIGVRCTSAGNPPETIVNTIDVLDSSACTTLGFVANQTIYMFDNGPTVSGVLTLVATNAPTVTATDTDTTNTAALDALLLRVATLETAPVSGALPPFTLSADTNLNAAASVAFSFEDVNELASATTVYSAGITHTNNTSTFTCSTAGTYLISYFLHENISVTGAKRMYGYSCIRRLNAGGATIYEYTMGGEYARNDNNTGTDDVVLSGTASITFNVNDKFQIVHYRLYAQSSDNIPVRKSLSNLRIERISNNGTYEPH